jgi:folate-binding protein YgfZ
MDRQSEYAAARHRAAYLPLPWRSIVAVEGRDAIPFLQGMLTQDIAGMVPGEVRRSCQLERKGHMVAELWVQRGESEVLLELQSDRVEPLCAILTHHIIALDVRLIPRPNLKVLLLCGPEAEEILRGAGLDAWSVRETAGPDFHLVCDDLDPTIGKLAQGGAIGIGGETLQRLRIEAGHAWFGPDIDEKNFPMEVNLDAAISYSKGCYIGQETIARVHYRGQTQRGLYGVRIPGDAPPVGSPVQRDGETIASLCSVTGPVVEGDSLALLMLQRKHHLDGETVQIGSPDATDAIRKGTLESLPFREARG